MDIIRLIVSLFALGVAIYTWWNMTRLDKQFDELAKIMHDHTEKLSSNIISFDEFMTYYCPYPDNFTFLAPTFFEFTFCESMGTTDQKYIYFKEASDSKEYWKYVMEHRDEFTMVSNDSIELQNRGFFINEKG